MAKSLEIIEQPKFPTYDSVSVLVEIENKDTNQNGKCLKKIARLTIVAKGKNFLTRILNLVSFKKSYFASLNGS